MKKFEVTYWLGDWWIIGQTKDTPSIKVKDFITLMEKQKELWEMIEEKEAN